MSYRGTPVTLVCGTVVDSWSREWLEETGARAVEAYAIVKMSDPQEGIRQAVARLGGGAEQARRLRAAVTDMCLSRIPGEVEKVVAMVYREDRIAHCDSIERRFGPEVAEPLRAAVRAAWEARGKGITQPPQGMEGNG